MINRMITQNKDASILFSLDHYKNYVWLIPALVALVDLVDALKVSAKTSKC